MVLPRECINLIVIWGIYFADTHIISFGFVFSHPVLPRRSCISYHINQHQMNYTSYRNIFVPPKASPLRTDAGIHPCVLVPEVWGVWIWFLLKCSLFYWTISLNFFQGKTLGAFSVFAAVATNAFLHWSLVLSP